GSVRKVLARNPGKTPADPERAPAREGHGCAVPGREGARDADVCRREVRGKGRRLRGRELRGKGLLPASGRLHHVLPGRRWFLCGVPARNRAHYRSLHGKVVVAYKRLKAYYQA